MADPVSTSQSTPVEGDGVFSNTNPSRVDSPDNSLPAAGSVGLSPVEAAAESARVAALEEDIEKVVTTSGEWGTIAEIRATEEALQAADKLRVSEAAERAVHEAALEKALSEGATMVEGVKNVVLRGSEGELLYSGPLEKFLAAQALSGPETDESGATTGAEALVSTRGSTHGEYWEMSSVTMSLMDIYQSSPNWQHLPDGVKVMFFNLAQKSARILTGSPLVEDHYADIAGYAYLAEQEVRAWNVPAAGGDEVSDD